MSPSGRPKGEYRRAPHDGKPASWRVACRSPWESISLMWRRRLLRLLRAQPSEHAHGRFALLAGDVVSEEVWVAGLYEQALLVPLFETLLRERGPDFAQQLALDVGANIGNHSLFFARRFAAVLAFEPNPTALAVLHCNVALAQAASVSIIPVGLGDRQGTFDFVQNESGNLGGSGFEFAGVKQGHTVRCELRRGDEVLAEQASPLRVGLIKLDVEGAELAALAGLAETLRQHQPVVLFESNQARGQAGGEAVMAALRELGYAEFWSVEEMGHGGTAWKKLLRRLLFGERIDIHRIHHLQERPYSMLVALPGAPQ